MMKDPENPNLDNVPDKKDPAEVDHNIPQELLASQEYPDLYQTNEPLPTNLNSSLDR